MLYFVLWNFTEANIFQQIFQTFNTPTYDFNLKRSLRIYILLHTKYTIAIIRITMKKTTALRRSRSNHYRRVRINIEIKSS